MQWPPILPLPTAKGLDLVDIEWDISGHISHTLRSFGETLDFFR